MELRVRSEPTRCLGEARASILEILRRYMCKDAGLDGDCVLRFDAFGR